MLATLILGIAAGALAPRADDHVKSALEGAFLSEATLSATELRSLSFALCLLGAAILAWIFGNGSAFALALGGVIGVFAPRIMDRARRRGEPDYGDDI